jgi:hypothetical protein
MEPPTNLFTYRYNHSETVVAIKYYGYNADNEPYLAIWRYDPRDVYPLEYEHVYTESSHILAMAAFIEVLQIDDYSMKPVAMHAFVPHVNKQPDIIVNNTTTRHLDKTRTLLPLEDRMHTRTVYNTTNTLLKERKLIPKISKGNFRLTKQIALRNSRFKNRYIEVCGRIVYNSKIVPPRTCIDCRNHNAINVQFCTRCSDCYIKFYGGLPISHREPLAIGETVTLFKYSIHHEASARLISQNENKYLYEVIYYNIPGYNTSNRRKIMYVVLRNNCSTALRDFAHAFKIYSAVDPPNNALHRLSFAFVALVGTLPFEQEIIL